jgi:hypothetical protein
MHLLTGQIKDFSEKLACIKGIPIQQFLQTTLAVRV